MDSIRRYGAQMTRIRLIITKIRIICVIRVPLPRFWMILLNKHKKQELEINNSSVTLSVVGGVSWFSLTHLYKFRMFNWMHFYILRI